MATIKEKSVIIKYYDNDPPLSPQQVKELILKSLDAEKAENILCIPLSDGSALADYMVIASGSSSRHVAGLARKLQEKLHKNNIKDLKTEGLAQCDWVVIDAGDVIIHLFRPEVREFYNIEKVWCHPPQYLTLETVDQQAQA
ncbi:MAG: ribosome silencing factor [Alphaproteobacteria bacterium]